MTAKHTPGPWTAKPREGTTGYLVSPPKGLCVAIVPRGFRSDEECEANARLLAAALRLRAALAALVDVCHEAPPVVLAEACSALADADGLPQVRMPTTGHETIGPDFEAETWRRNGLCLERQGRRRCFLHADHAEPHDFDEVNKRLNAEARKERNP
jgi:FAD/FMN-containing dehydrogenase